MSAIECSGIKSDNGQLSFSPQEMGGYLVAIKVMDCGGVKQKGSRTAISTFVLFVAFTRVSNLHSVYISKSPPLTSHKLGLVDGARRGSLLSESILQTKVMPCLAGLLFGSEQSGGWSAADPSMMLLALKRGDRVGSTRSKADCT